MCLQLLVHQLNILVIFNVLLGVGAVGTITVDIVSRYRAAKRDQKEKAIAEEAIRKFDEQENAENK